MPNTQTPPAYSQSNYRALARRVRQNRTRQTPGPTHASQVPEAFLARSQKQILKPKRRAALQQSFPFASDYQALDIYHQFDPEAREVEWFFYSESGDFLLQFGFSLKDHAYEVYAAHPGLWMDSEKLHQYLPAIQNSLAEHYPPLELTHKDNGVVEISRKD